MTAPRQNWADWDGFYREGDTIIGYAPQRYKNGKPFGFDVLFSFTKLETCERCGLGGPKFVRNRWFGDNGASGSKRVFGTTKRTTRYHWPHGCWPTLCNSCFGKLNFVARRYRESHQIDKQLRELKSEVQSRRMP